MKVYGLTGGVGMGKSTSEKFLSESGIKVIDTDAVARRLVEPGSPALEEITKAFGHNIINADRTLNRSKLADIVFADASARNRLEAILHPKIRETWQTQIAFWRDEGCQIAVVVIPLLFETDSSPQFNQIVCVACTVVTQQARLSARGWDKTHIPQRIAAQWPIEKKMTLSHRVIWTEGELETHREQLRHIFG